MAACSRVASRHHLQRASWGRANLQADRNSSHLFGCLRSQNCLHSSALRTQTAHKPPYIPSRRFTVFSAEGLLQLGPITGRQTPVTCAWAPKPYHAILFWTRFRLASERESPPQCAPNFSSLNPITPACEPQIRRQISSSTSTLARPPTANSCSRYNQSRW